MEDSSQKDKSLSEYPTSLFASVGLFAAGRLNEDNKLINNQPTWLSNESFKRDVNVANKLKLEDETAERPIKEKSIEIYKDSEDDYVEDNNDKDHKSKKRKNKKDKKKKSKKSRNKSPNSRRSYSREISNDKDAELLKYQFNSVEDTKIKYCQGASTSKDIENDFFKIDRKYIKDNLMYDSLYFKDIPKYRTDESRSLKYKKGKLKRYFREKLGKCLMNISNQLNNESTSKLTKLSNLTDNQDFIKLIDTKEILEVDQINKPNKIELDEINYDNQYLYNQIKEFNSYLNQNPNDIDKWIEFVKFQDEILIELNNKENDLKDRLNRLKSKDEVYLNEKKLLILEKALKSNPANVKLMVAKLELLRTTMEPNELNEEWTKLAFTYPTDFEIIKNYMKFIITHISYFNLNNLNKFFKRYMEKIVQYQEGHLKSIRAEKLNVAELEKSMFEILFLYTTILKQCGFIERSISIWQALIEFNFNRPDFLNKQTSLDDCKEYFDIFWSSGEQRFGEKRSVGWKKTLEIRSKKKPEDELSNKGEQIDKEEINLLDEKENEIVLNSNKDLNKIWFEIEQLRERYNWLSAKLHEDCDDTDHIVLVDDISICLFRFKDKNSYRNSLIYFLCFLNAIKFNLKPSKYSARSTNNLVPNLTHLIEPEIIINLPYFCLDNEELFLNCTNSKKIFTPKYFTYNQYITFTISVFHQSMDLMESQNLADYHELVSFYLDFIIKNVKQLDKEQSRKLFKNILKKPFNCNKIVFWKKFVELEVQLNELTSAKNIFYKILDMLTNPQFISSKSSDQQILSEILSLIHDFIEFNLRVESIKPISLDMINFLKIDAEKKEIGEEILIFIYSLLNSKKFKSIKEINSPVQLRTTQKVRTLIDECFEQVAKFVEHNRIEDNENKSLDQQLNNNLIYLIIFQIYNCYFNRLINQASLESPSKILDKTSKLINDYLNKIKTIKSNLTSDYLIEKLFEKHLDLHLLYLKFNFGNLIVFNKLLHQAINQFPRNSYFLTLLVKSESFRLINGEVEKYTFTLCSKMHQTTLEQWLYVIFSEIQRLSNLQQQSIEELVKSSNSFSKSPSENIDRSYKAIDHAGTYTIGLVSRIRNIFEKALQVHSCLLLWRMYLHFEVNQKNLENAKKIFYRALQQCPWNKLLYMDGVQIFTMNTTMNESKKFATDNKSLIGNVQNLNDLLALMIEKQLRVRTAVEEVQFLVNNQQKFV